MKQQFLHKVGCRKREILTPIHYILFILLLAFGIAAVIFSYQKITRSYEMQALNIVRALSATLDEEELRELSAQGSDEDTPAFIEMKKLLLNTLSATNEAAAAYFFTLRDGSVYFIVDSNLGDSLFPSSPGQLFENAPPEAYKAFTQTEPIMSKGYTDRWGDWVSAFIQLPSQDGEIPIAFGLDFNFAGFYSHAKWQTLSIAVILGTLLSLLVLAALALKNNSLLQEEKIKAVEVASLVKTLQQRDFQEKTLIATTLHSLGEAVISTDIEGRVVIMNRMAQQLTGWSVDDAKGRSLKEVYQIVDGFTLQPLETYRPFTVLKTGIPMEYDNREVKLIHKDGNLTAIEDVVTPIIDEKGKVTGVVLVFADGTEKRVRRDELLYLSTHDGLTGLLNRQSFYAKVEELDSSEHYPLMLMLLDINGLKLINEAYGHATGDSLLNEIAVILQRPWHRDQMVGRVDGDEFALFFPNVPEGLEKSVSQEIQEALSEQSFLGYALTISTGFAKKEYAQTSMSELLKKAEDDLFRNKFVENQSARLKMVDLLLQSLFKKSIREMEHSKRVGSLAQRFARHLRFSEAEEEALHSVGVMHDIGKIAISSKILNKKESLNDEEWKEIRRHPEIGFNLLSSVNQYAPLAEQVLCHHERWDGTGYPNQIAGETIPLYSRILALCDSFDAMTNMRPYKNVITVNEALDEIQRCSSRQFDPNLAGRFIEMIREES